MPPDPTKPPRRLLYVVNEDWAFLLNRLPMARAAQKTGFEVHVATRVNDGARDIEAEGFTLHPIPLQRGESRRYRPFPLSLHFGRSRTASNQILPITPACNVVSTGRSPPSAGSFPTSAR